jgi:ammonia channel protein AmtB
LAITVNLIASLPSAAAALVAGRLNSRVPSTLLIAAGGMVVSVTSGLGRFGETSAHAIGLLIGLLLIFLGFLVSIEVFSDVRLPFTRIVLRRRDRGSEAVGR